MHKNVLDFSIGGRRHNGVVRVCGNQESVTVHFQCFKSALGLYSSRYILVKISIFVASLRGPAKSSTTESRSLYRTFLITQVSLVGRIAIITLMMRWSLEDRSGRPSCCSPTFCVVCRNDAKPDFLRSRLTR